MRNFALSLAMGASLKGCTTYKPAPLDLTPVLKPSLAALDHATPQGAPIPLAQPLTQQNVAALAVLNDPNLIAMRAQQGTAAAQLLGAGLPPDPSISFGFDALISGPADVPSISGALAQDISALIAYRVDRLAAKSGLAQVDAGILWQEWLTASQAEQLCITINGDIRLAASLRSDEAALAEVNASTRDQTLAGNLTLVQTAAAQSALAANIAALNTAVQALGQDRDQLDLLLGLQPGVAVAVRAPTVAAIDPAVAARAIASLADRRPDLIALRYGYQQADARLRAAILTQFLPVSLGGTAGRDTTNVVSAGPQVTLTLPIFNRNRAAIAGATATRVELADQFRASLARAAGDAQALLARIAVLRTESQAAEIQADEAREIASDAARAYSSGAVDAQSAVNLQTASSERAREAIMLRVQLQTAQLSLATMLGLGLPPMAFPVQEGSR